MREFGNEKSFIERNEQGANEVSRPNYINHIWWVVGAGGNEQEIDSETSGIIASRDGRTAVYKSVQPGREAWTVGDPFSQPSVWRRYRFMINHTMYGQAEIRSRFRMFSLQIRPRFGMFSPQL